MPLSPAARRCLLTMTRDDAEWYVMRAETADLDGPEVEAAYEFLRRVYQPEDATTPSDRLERDTPPPPPGWADADAGGGAAAASASPFDAFPDVDAAPAADAGADMEETSPLPTAEVEPSPVDLLLEQQPPDEGFLRLPTSVIHGELGALLERACPGLAWLVVVLLRYADRRDHIVTASKITLCRECGLSEDRTLDKRLRLLCEGHKQLGLPALLRPVPGPGARYAFRAEGLATLAERARRTLQDREQRLKGLRRAQSAGGQKGMASRWGPPPRRGR